MSTLDTAVAHGPDTVQSLDLGVLVSCATVVAERAGAVDRAESDVRPALQELGREGLLSLGARGHAGTLREQADVIRTLARGCMATAFATWAQRMAIEYLAGWAGPELRDGLLEDLVAGRRAGATAMATAFQDALGLREIGVTAEQRDGHIVLDGTIPWASNLFADGAVVVLPARTPEGQRVIVAITTDLAGVERAPEPPLLALGATASTSVRLEGVRVPESYLLTTRFLDFLTDVRPTFLLLQTAFCLGIADAALDGASGRFAGASAVLEADHEALTARRDELDRVHRELLATCGPADTPTIRLRLDAGTFAVDATRHESTVRGGAGYLAGSPVARRLREAAFLPIQSPTEAQLRWELSRSA